MATTMPRSFLYGVVEKMRFYLESDEADKYEDDFIVRNIIMSEYVNVLNAVNLGRAEPIISMFTFSIDSDVEGIVLPPHVYEVQRLYQISDEGRITRDWIPQHQLSPRGPGWYLDGNEIIFRPDPPDFTDDWVIAYIPSGDMCLHYGVGKVDTATATSTVIELAASPVIGILDTRPNAYLGAVLRVLENGKPVNERVISSYSVGDRKATLRRVIASGDLPAEAQNVTYEIAPFGHQAMREALATQGAISLGIPRGISQAKIRTIDIKYARAIKTLRDTFGNIQARTGKVFDRVTVDNENIGFTTLRSHFALGF